MLIIANNEGKMMDLGEVFKPYDIRGVAGETLNRELFYATGVAFAEYFQLENTPVVIGRDMRETGVEYSEAFIEGLLDVGVKEIINIGDVPTDVLYFASGHLNAAGAMFTASHNPKQYNGLKLCLPGASGVSYDTGLHIIKIRVKNILQEGYEKPYQTFGKVETKNIIPEYVEKLHSIVNLEGAGKIKIVVDASNGMAGKTVTEVFRNTQHEIIPMFFEPDGDFPNHPADPLNPKNLKDCKKKIRETKANLGLVFDGDADRCFMLDEKGNPISPSIISSIIATTIAASHGNPEQATMLYSSLTSKEFKETLQQLNVNPVRIKVGHSPAKQKMKETNALFGGEQSAHYYFGDFYGADSGMLAALYFIKTMSNENAKPSELAVKHDPYYQNGETNFTVENYDKLVQKIETLFDHKQVEHYDGVTVSSHSDEPFWYWFNIRPSNTEPLVRLNVESNHKMVLKIITNIVENIIKTAK